MIGDPGSHGGRPSLQGAVTPAEVVEAKVQSQGRVQVFPLLTEGVGQPSEAFALLAKRSVLAFDV